MITAKLDIQQTALDEKLQPYGPLLARVLHDLETNVITAESAPEWLALGMVEFGNYKTKSTTQIERSV